MSKAFTYAQMIRICENLPITADSRGDHPSDYETLSEPEKAALRHWIRGAIVYSPRYDTKHTSYGIKHDFEYEGFYITNGQFKGAMLIEGHKLKNAHDLNWIFRIDKSITRTAYKRWQKEDQYWRYSLGKFDKEFARLLVVAGYI